MVDLGRIDIESGLMAPAGEDEETAEIYRREARASVGQDKVATAALLLDAAFANERDEAPEEDIVRDLLLAAALAPNTPWVLESAHRMMLRLGRWQEALEFLAREFRPGDAPDSLQAIAMTSADLLWIVADKPREAMAWVQKALASDPNHVEALYAGLCMSLLPVESGGDPKQAETFALSLAKILGAPEERAILYGLAGSIQMAGKRDADALESYAQAAQADRTNPYIQLKFALLNEKFGKLQDAAQCYAQLATLFEDKALCGAFYRRAGILQGYAGQSERSSLYLNESYKFYQNDHATDSEDKFGIIWMAIDAMRRSGNMQRVIELERQLVEMAENDETKAAHQMAIADVCFEGMGAVDSAVEALEAASEAGAGYMADSRLAAIYESRGDWTNLAKILGHMSTRSQLEAPACLWLMADALQQSGAKDKAIETLTPLANGLGRLRLDLLLEETQNHDAHARMLDKWYRESTDDATKSAILSQILTILTERLNAPEIAIQYQKGIASAAPSRDLAWRQLHLMARMSNISGVVEGMLRIAAETSDGNEARMLCLEAALLKDRALKDTAGAIEILCSVHENYPNDVPSIVLLRMIGYRERRYDLILKANGWRGLFQMSSAQRAEIACENAWACLHLEDDASAAEWFEKARHHAPLDAYAFRLYVDLLRKMGRWKEVVRVIRESLPLINGENGPAAAKQDNAGSDNAENIDDGWDIDTDDLDAVTDEVLSAMNTPAQALSAEQRAWREVMLDIQTHCLKSSAGTVYARQQHFEADPTIENFVDFIIEKFTTDPVESHLSVLLSARGKLSSVSPETQSLIDWVQAETLRMGHPDGAPERVATSIDTLLRRSLNQPYGNCLRADILRCHRELPKEDIIAWLEKYAAFTRDRWMCHALSREAMMRVIWIEQDYEPSSHRKSMADICEETDRRSLWMLEHYASLTEDWQALGYFRERLAQLEVDTLARLQVLKSALAPYVDAELTNHAVRVAQECLKLNAHAYPALITLAHIAEDSDDRVSLASIADRLSEASASLENRTSYGLWAAQLWSKLSRPDQALACLGRLLAHDPTCAQAIAMSEQLYESQGRFDLLARIYTRATAALPEGETQIALLRKHAHISAEKLNDPASASLSLAKIIAQNPADLDALAMHADLLIEQARWNEAVDVLEQISKVAENAERRRTTNLKLADILVHQLEQQDRAKRLLRRHLNLFDHDMPALHLLYEIACVERNWNDAKSTLEEICCDEGSVDTRKARLEFTRVAREAGWSHDIRTLYEKQAIAAVLDHRDDFDALVDDYRTHGELPRLIDVTRRELGKQGNPEMVAKYRGCVAALLVANKQHREALSFLSEIIHESQDTDWAYLARAQALTSAGQLPSAVGEYRRTLTRNIHLDDAFDPFVEVLKQTGDDITLASVAALRDQRRKTGTAAPWERCVKGGPCGFFDIELIPLNRAFIDAQRYLYKMTPYAFEMFTDGVACRPLAPTHWAYTRCLRLFGQNIEIKHIYVAPDLGPVKCRAKLDDEAAIVFDESLIDELNQIPFDFWAAYAMHQSITGGALIDVLKNESVEALFCALCQPRPESELAQTMKKQLFRVLPRTDRKLFKDGVPFLSPNWTDFREALQTRASCVAATLCACPAYALHAHPDDPALEVFLISENYVRFVKKFWS